MYNRFLKNSKMHSTLILVGDTVSNCLYFDSNVHFHGPMTVNYGQILTLVTLEI